MRRPYRAPVLAAAVAATVALSVNAGVAREGPSSQTDPGFNPATGQINPGVPQEFPSSSPTVRAVPAPEEARKAFISFEPVPTAAPSPNTASQNAGAAAPNKPIGATTQTVPATLSKRNDILDRVPTADLAWPIALSDEQRQRIYQAVMADQHTPASDAAKLAPADELSTHQALDEMNPLPSSVAGMPELKSLKYVKTDHKVLLVDPVMRTVVAQITE